MYAHFLIFLKLLLYRPSSAILHSHMDIKYLGHSSFLIKSKGTKIITDPFDPQMVGLPYPKQEADIVAISHHHKDHDNVSAVADPKTVIDWPGEFEIKGVRVFGYPSYHDKQQGAERGEVTLFKFEMEDMSVLHCGDIGLVPEASFIDAIGSVDVLLVPVGGFYTITPAEAAKLVQKIDPSIVIPMHFNTEKLNQSNFGEMAPVDDFIKEMAGEVQQIGEKVSIKKEDLKDSTIVYIMKTS